MSVFRAKVLHIALHFAFAITALVMDTIAPLQAPPRWGTGEANEVDVIFCKPDADRRTASRVIGPIPFGAPDSVWFAPGKCSSASCGDGGCLVPPRWKST